MIDRTENIQYEISILKRRLKSISVDSERMSYGPIEV